MSTDHNCYDHYELKDYSNLFSCDGCKMKGYGRRYHCAPCGGDLHRECRHPRTTIHHDFFGASTFEFRREPLTKPGRRREFSKCCDACGEDIRGFSYRYEETDKDLHPCCGNLEEKLLVDGAVFDLRSDVSSRCARCRRKKIAGGARDVRGWSYVSAGGEYHFHVHCMAESVHDACVTYGEAGPENVELRRLARPSGGRGSRAERMLRMIKSAVKIILAALLGDPTMLVSNVVVELVSRGL